MKFFVAILVFSNGMWNYDTSRDLEATDFESCINTAHTYNEHAKFSGADSDYFWFCKWSK